MFYVVVNGLHKQTVISTLTCSGLWVSGFSQLNNSLSCMIITINYHVTLYLLERIYKGKVHNSNKPNMKEG